MPSTAVRTLVSLACALGLASSVPAATITVTGPGDTIAVDSAVTLREAIASINAAANVNGDVSPVGTYGVGDTIGFNIPGGGPHTLSIVGTPLPVINRPMVIDGYTQPGTAANTLAVGDNAVLLIILQGTISGAHGLELGVGAAASVIRGLNLQHHFFAIQINTSGVIVAGNFIGTDRTATVADATTFNNVGVNVNIGNIGNNFIGGSTPADRNVISGNGGAVILNSQLGNTVRGNYIGLNGAGTAALPNGSAGVTVGSVGVAGIAGPTIGGVTASPGQGAGNVISGNGSRGIQISTTGAGSIVGAGTIEGNIIGLDAAGTTAIPNTGPNVYLFDTDLPTSGVPRLGPITIGGSAAGAGNVLSGGGHGIFAVAEGTVIRGNRIGTDVTGTLARPNNFGIEITGTNVFAGSATIGGSGPNDGNVVSGNQGDGIRVFLATATIQGNRIGVGAAGASLGNTGFGIFVDSGETTIGGTVAGAGNVIANNGDHGLQVRIGFSAAHNASNAAILGNSITANAQLGVNNSVPDLVTPNDPGDGDSGPNDLQNFPVLTAATLAVGSVTVSGTLNSTPNSTFRVELFSNTTCDGSGFGEGASFLGAVNVTTNGSGDGSFGPTPFTVPAGQTVITATATNPANHSSELSQCLTAGGGPPPPPPTLSIDSVSANEGNAGTTPFVFTVTLSAASATPVTVNYATADGTANTPADYAATAGTLTFNPGGPLTQTITVQVAGELLVEGNETFFVDLSGASGATIGASRGTGTIVNDDVEGPPPPPVDDIPTLSQRAMLLLAGALALLGMTRLRW